MYIRFHSRPCSAYLIYFSLFPLTLSLFSESVQGVVECGETVLEVTGNSHQKLSWKSYGFYVTVPEGAVPKDVTIHLAVKAILSGQFLLPNNTQLVSAIYWISASQKFQKKVSIHLNHCAIIASADEASKYKFILGKCSQKVLPYTFKIKNGIFLPQSQLATISLEQFSFVAAIHEGPEKPPLKYISHYYLKKDNPTELEAMLLVTVDLPAQVEVCLLCLGHAPAVHLDYQCLAFLCLSLRK